MSLLVSTLLILTLAPDGGSTQMPEALRRAQEARSTEWIKTARIEYVIHDRTDEESHHDYFFAWSCANDDYITIQRGDEDGIIVHDEHGGPSPFCSQKPVHRLTQGTDIWEHAEDAPNADRYGPSMHYYAAQPNMRHFGLSPRGTGEDLATLEEVARRYYGRNAIQYTTTIEDTVYVVTARTFGGAFKWWIDPAKDWNVLRTETWLNGEQIGEDRYTLKKCDGHWFPVRQDEYRLAAGDVEPSRVIELSLVEFNRPEHLQSLALADIGIKPGTIVYDRQLDSVGTTRWDGSRLVDIVRIKTRDPICDLLQSPDVSSLTLPGRPQWQGIESEWEAYTRRFVANHALDAGQTERAWAILRDCQSRGQTYITRQRAALEAMNQEYDDLQAAVRASAPNIPARRDKLTQTRQKLTAPLIAIFEDHLKPRLDRLLTRQQRAAAQQGKKPPTTQPAARGAATNQEGKPHAPRSGGGREIPWSAGDLRYWRAGLGGGGIISHSGIR